MKILRITAKDVKKLEGNDWSDYIGTESVTNFDGHIEIEASLGYVRFSSLKVSGHINT